MKFIDETIIRVAAGHGGAGMVSFKTARNKPKLGPDGGNGGIGGDVIVVGRGNLNTLSTLRYKQDFEAEHGARGGTSNKTGRCGDTLYIQLPLGTVIFDVDTGTCVGELLCAGDEILVAKGGKRGYGNLSYTSSLRRAPYMATAGEKGAERHLRLELKLLADIGLAGLPNAGKSSLLSVLSAAKPKIADYPFTTLTPQLGVVDVSQWGGGDESFVLADIPGLVQGASEGRGLGLRFLKHLERTQLVAYVIDMAELDKPEDLWAVYKLLRKELEAFNPAMAARAGFVILNKIDAFQHKHASQLSQSEMAQLETDILDGFRQEKLEVMVVSALARTGLKDLVFALQEHLKTARLRFATEETDAFRNEGITHDQSLRHAQDAWVAAATCT